MASRIVQYFADKLRTVKEYPITLTKAVYDENGNRLDNKLQEIDNSISDASSGLSKIQKGVTTTVGISSSADIKLAVPYSNTNYTVIATVEFKDTASKFCVANVYKRNNDTFTIYTFDSATNTPVGGITVSWVAIGN